MYDLFRKQQLQISDHKKIIHYSKKHLREPEKSTNLIECLKLESELTFTTSGGNVFHIFTMLSKKINLGLKDMTFRYCIVLYCIMTLPQTP